MKITPDIKRLITRALTEDAVLCDFTTTGLKIGELEITAVIYAGCDGILAGLDVCAQVFKTLGRIKWKPLMEDGCNFKSGDRIVEIQGRAKVILGGERTALNFLSHLSGVATFTSRFVHLVSGNKIRIYDTRKTLPGLRRLEKYAVKIGGGWNHRMDLSLALMIKDNHISCFKKIYHGDDYIIAMVNKLRQKYPRKELIVEVHNFQEWEQAIKACPDVVMFDNWKPEDIEIALKMVGKRRKFEIEISGNINLEQLEKIMELGIDRISLGKITHSAPAIDFSLEVI